MPLNINFQQICLHLFNFVLLFMILYLLLYRPVKNFFEKRRAHYEEMDRQAARKVEEGEAVRLRYTESLQGVDGEIRELREKAVREAEEQRKTILARANEEAARIIEQAKAVAEHEKKRILSETNQDISRMVTNATAKIVFPDMESAYDSFLDTVEGSEADEQV